jgi:holin-like protein
MIGGFALLLLFLLAGEALSLAGVPMPGNVLGMLLLATGLATGLIQRRWIEAAVRFLLDHLALFFVPAGVGLMAHSSLLESHWPAMSFSIIVSYLIVLVSSGLIQRALTAKRRREGGPRD